MAFPWSSSFSSPGFLVFPSVGIPALSTAFSSLSLLLVVFHCTPGFLALCHYSLLLLFSLSSLSNNFAWFVWNVLFWTYCSTLLSYLCNLDDVVTTFCFSSLITLSVLYLLPFMYFQADPWLLHYEVYLYSINLNG